VDDAGEQRRLGQREAARARAEERARRHLDAVGPLSEIDGVQVVGEDLVFGPALLELVGEHRLAQLARERLGGALVGGQVGVLDELLGDRRAALHGVAGAQVAHEGPGDGGVVDAGVLVEAAVLDGHDGLFEHRRDLARRHDDPALVAAQHRQQVGLGGAVVDVGVAAHGLVRGDVELRQAPGDRRQGGAQRQSGHARHGHDDAQRDDRDDRAVVGVTVTYFASAHPHRASVGRFAALP
jgi:hypothetical protein